MSLLRKEVETNILDLLPEHKEYVRKNLFDAFFLPEEKLVKVQNLLNEEINLQLHPDTDHDDPLKLFPSYIEEVPDGTESGRFLAVDIGGTRCRVLLVDVHNGKTSSKTIKEDLPASCYTGSGVKVFDYIAGQLHWLLSECNLLNTPEPIQLGFTFSFPIKTSALHKAILVNWTKDYRGNDVIGMEVGQLLEDAIKRRGDMNIKCCAIINDTIGTLMCGAFIDKGCKIGLICGTGTNGCCFEPIDNCVDYKKTVQTKNKAYRENVVRHVPW
ncbi:hexokinase-1-like isoform X1 [Mercenaria mercenaria]|uniref:hexokinase-1-like isoform X1 n=1 Tax=Mercenaria mercenaria TaxID=6596 RepID=UPI00234EAEA1|nr:hexokinase-1-like isoform X1 [Mercenaria mercenaria]